MCNFFINKLFHRDQIYTFNVPRELLEIEMAQECMT